MPGFLGEIYRDLDGKILEQSEAYFVKNHHYPAGVSFEAFRGKDFCEIEEEMAIIMPKHAEIVPAPYLSSDGHIVRLNSVIPPINIDDYLNERESD